MLAVIEDIFQVAVEYCVLALEMVGVVIIVWTAIKCVYELFRHEMKVRLDLAEGIAMALEFKLAGEVLRTTIVRDWTELGTLGAIIILRAAMTVLIHWEIKNEEAKLS